VNISAGVLGLDFELRGVNVGDAFMGHIHCGSPTENGPVVVWLAGDPPSNTAYSTLVELITAMAQGRTYVNIHTRANPGGEVRGQIQLVAPFTIP
jgi:hypothetical protein